MTDLLTGLGVTDTGVSEHGFNDAKIEGTFRGRHVLVWATPRPDGTVVSVGEPLGSGMRAIRQGQLRGVRFGCGDINYYVFDYPLGTSLAKGEQERAAAFAGLLIESLECRA